MSLTIEELEAFVQKLAADTERWAALVSHDPDHRTYGQIWDDDEVNAWVLCWSAADHDTGFHDHDVSAAAVTVIAGQVREDRLRLDGSAREIVYDAGQTLTVPPEAIHRVLHAGSGPAVTIHAYSPPLRKQGAYALADDGILTRVVQSWQDELKADTALLAGVH
ncbi:MAG: cysteine dioxygenase family protein [Conexibacteraceae bacterium]|nr:cysteine dioxygenase family protein [Conexibacteraceae bacterium]